ncbi:hypothetical protein VN1258_14400 [Helicobacter pylori]|nr:hypothetical protein VN1258_14400 [Helicobacter pylori]
MVLYHYYFKTPKSFPLEYLHLCTNESHLLRLDFDATQFFSQHPYEYPIKTQYSSLGALFLGTTF